MEDAKIIDGNLTTSIDEHIGVPEPPKNIVVPKIMKNSSATMNASIEFEGKKPELKPTGLGQPKIEAVDTNIQTENDSTPTCAILKKRQAEGS